MRVKSVPDGRFLSPARDQHPPAALLLELCGVLYDDSCWRRWMLQLLSRMGLRTHYTAFFQVWEQEHFCRVCSGEAPYWEAMRGLLRSVGLPPGRVAEACAAGKSRRRQWERAIRPLPGVARTLRQLSQRGVPLAVIAHASFDEPTALDKLAQLGLDATIGGGVMSTSELGRRGRFDDRFAVAAARLGLPPQRVAYVGCGRLPLLQAAAAGLQCIAFNADIGAAPCVELDSFAQLADVARGARRLRAG